jgi:hypothetical protein
MPVRKWGTEKRVNQTIAEDQYHSSVAVLADGTFMVVWQNGYEGDVDASIRARHYDATGAALGGEVTLLSVAGDDHFAPEAIGLPDGSFYVTWQTLFADSDNDVLAAVFDEDGTLVRYQNAAASITFNQVEISGAVAASLSAPGSNSVHVWQDDLGVVGDASIQMSIFNAAGVQQGATLTVEPAPNVGTDPAVAMSPDGNAIAVAYWYGFDTLGLAAYTSSGMPLFAAKTISDDVISEPDVVFLDNETILVVSRKSDGSFFRQDIFGAIYATNGVAVVPEFRLNSTSLEIQDQPVVAPIPGGGFVCAWTDYSVTAPDGYGAAIRLRAFDGLGLPLGGELVVNMTTSFDQLSPSIRALQDGRVVVTWTDYGSGEPDIRMQIVDPRDGLVTGTGGADVLWGHDAANDQIDGAAGNDLMRGLKGNDQLYGGEGNDDAFGGGGDDVAYGGAGVDTLLGEEGADDLFGEDGNDDLRGGAGADALDGGAGIDTANYGSSTSLTVALDGSLAATGDAAGDSFASVEYLKGSNAAGSGDTLRGDGGANALYGNAGNDNLNGMAGHDKLVGGLGADTMAGGTGNDQFIYNLLTELPDVLTDFTSNAAGNNDVFLFKGSVFGGLPAGLITAAQFQSSTAATAANGNIRFFYETDTRILRFDADGSGAGSAPLVVATLQVGATMSFQDISIF